MIVILKDWIFKAFFHKNLEWSLINSPILYHLFLIIILIIILFKRLVISIILIFIILLVVPSSLLLVKLRNLLIFFINALLLCEIIVRLRLLYISYIITFLMITLYFKSFRTEIINISRILLLHFTI